MTEPAPLDDDLRALFAEEREAYTMDEARKSRLYRRVEARVALAGIGGSAAPPSAPSDGAGAAGAPTQAASWLGKGLFALLAAFGLGLLAGEGHRLLDSPKPLEQSPLVRTESSATAVPDGASSGATKTIEASVEPAALPSVTASVAPSVPEPAASGAQAKRPASTLAEEQALVDRARAALSRGRAADAKAATDEHVRRFPHGSLSEEREVLAIQALLGEGNRDGAKARADRFRKAYPRSVFLPSVERLVGAP